MSIFSFDQAVAKVIESMPPAFSAHEVTQQFRELVNSKKLKVLSLRPIYIDGKPSAFVGHNAVKRKVEEIARVRKWRIEYSKKDTQSFRVFNTDEGVIASDEMDEGIDHISPIPSKNSKSPKAKATKPTIEPKAKAAKPTIEPKAKAAKPTIEPKAKAAKPTIEPKAKAAKPTIGPKAKAAKPTIEPKAKAAKPTIEPKAKAAKPKAAKHAPNPVKPPKSIKHHDDLWRFPLRKYIANQHQRGNHPTLKAAQSRLKGWSIPQQELRKEILKSARILTAKAKPSANDTIAPLKGH